MNCASCASNILIKDAASLELAHKLQTIVLDKTEKITQGKPSITDYQAVRGVTDGAELKLLRFVAAVERNSEHPLAEAVVRYAQSQKLNIPESHNFEAVAGSGVQGIVADCEASGRHRLV